MGFNLVFGASVNVMLYKVPHWVVLGYWSIDMAE